MKKLRLSLDDITVESFSTLSPRLRLGTVAANQMSATTCQQIICDCTTQGFEQTCQTCGASCNGTCDASCNGTCNGCPEPSANGTCAGWTCEGTCGFTCNTCAGYSCEYCSAPGQIICDP
ncbi:hypothetical protein [Longimicrobium sp.]|uniref:hypothetical protein n=1 Tax=Longimicrobium sp. TaxID=2029185 RepID=UPI003B3BCACE